MNNNIYSDRGIKITDNILKIGYTTISLSSISSVHTFPVPRHSLLAGLKEWFYGLIFMIIICAIFTQISILGDIYIFTIFILIGYNIYEHRKAYLGLEICTTGGQSYKIKSEDIIELIPNSELVDDDSVKNILKDKDGVVAFMGCATMSHLIENFVKELENIE